METKKADDAAPERVRVGFDGRGLVQVVCTQVDWTTYAQAAIDSDAMGAMVGAAVRILGQTMECAAEGAQEQTEEAAQGPGSTEGTADRDAACPASN